MGNAFHFVLGRSLGGPSGKRIKTNRWNVFLRKFGRCVTNQQARFTNGPIADGDALDCRDAHFLFLIVLFRWFIPASLFC